MYKSLTALEGKSFMHEKLKYMIFIWKLLFLILLMSRLNSLFLYFLSLIHLGVANFGCILWGSPGIIVPGF